MKKNYLSKVLIPLFSLCTLLYTNTASSQCSIVGLNPTYCLDAVPVYLTADPMGGTFSGPGVADGIFTPADAGVGTHTIEYSFFSGADRWYIRSTVGDPWGNTTNNTAMNDAFGAGEWELGFFESVDVAAVFSVSTSFVFLEGSDDNANELNSFLAANLSEIEAWVNAGGVILINAAPNEGGDINFGFGGTTLNYDLWPGTVNAVDAGHPVFAGPLTPTATTMTGSSYAHGRITGTGYDNILTAGGDVILAEKSWGGGYVIVGAMTTVNYHNPDPQAQNFRANLFVYADELVESGVECVATTDVVVLDEVSPDVTAESDIYELCLGGSYTLTGSGADDFYWGAGIVDGEPNTPETAGTYTHLLTGISPAGCIGTSLVTITVHPIPFVDAGLDQTQCADMEMTLSATGAETYEWDGGIEDGEPFTVTEGETTYTVTGTDENGCQDTDEVVVTGIGYPNVTADIIHAYAPFTGEIDITVSGGIGPFAFDWSHGPTTEDVAGLNPGDYTVIVDDGGVEDGICPEVEATFTVISTIGVEELDLEALSVFPSPTTDLITITLEGQFDYEIVDITGAILLRGTANDNETVSLEQYAAGTYFVNVSVDGNTKTAKIVKK